jgi:TRAP-type C4-dicarboxylate transport system permease small subunit
MVEKGVKKEILDKLATLSSAAFGLVAALAWNSAIQSWFQSRTLLSQGGPWLYAILVTILAVLVTVFIARATSKVETISVKKIAKKVRRKRK